MTADLNHALADGRRGRRRSAMLVAALAGALAVPATLLALNPGTSTIPSTGQSLDIEITGPIDGSTVPAGDPVAVTGKVGIGGLSADANVSYVVDVSGSTSNPAGQDCNGDAAFDVGDDLNGDGNIGDTLDCEISGVLALNTSLSAVSGLEAGVVAFGSFAVAADVIPAAGQQNFTSPLNVDNDANTVADLEEVLRSLDQGSVGLFTPYGTSTGTSFDNALAAMNAAFVGQPATEPNIGFFLSDGISSLATGVGSPLQGAIDAGTVVNTYSVGGNSTGCSVGADLRTIADSTGGVCTEVTDPADLAAVIGGVNPAGIDKVEISIDGGPAIPASLDALGNFSATIPGASITGPTHLIEATVTADDPDATTATADVTINTEGDATGTINVVKRVDSEPDGVFDNDASGWTFDVDDATGTVASDVTAADGLLSFTVDAADGYSLRETAGPAGLWHSTWSCVDDDDSTSIASGFGLVPPGAATGDFDVAADQSITCTFDNQLLAGFMTGGGQIIDDAASGKRKDQNWISFGGNVGIRLDGSLHGQWQANLHNVSDDDLDKGNFHSTSIDSVTLADLSTLEDAAPPESVFNFIEFQATGRFNGEDGWSVLVRATDTGEPGNGKNAGDDSDSLRIQLFDPSDALVYDSATDFSAEQDDRHNLDHGNLQIHRAD